MSKALLLIALFTAVHCAISAEVLGEGHITKTVLTQLKIDWNGRPPRGQIRFLGGATGASGAGGYSLVITASGSSLLELDFSIADGDGNVATFSKCGFFSDQCFVITVNRQFKGEPVVTITNYLEK